MIFDKDNCCLIDGYFFVFFINGGVAIALTFTEDIILHSSASIQASIYCQKVLNFHTSIKSSAQCGGYH
uniref:hypothetical protein n=1 Tax=Yersinia enterocolitica TaxID=630 RepID=UPI0014592B43|nr:hypothetical protein [Yersinia enterocolitica]